MPGAGEPGLLARARTAIAVAGLLALGVAALLSGSDRQSRDFPNSPSFVGWPYDTGAARAKAAIAFVRSGPASAIGYARRAIQSDPISAQAVSILGRAQLYSQHQPEAWRAFQISGQLGWRDAMTQIYWLDQALQDGNYRVAAERLDALLRQSPDDENRDRFVAAVAATPEGRAALANRLKLAPAWALLLMSDVRDLPADTLVQRVDLMRRTGRGVWDCPATEMMTQRLISVNLVEEAQSIWAQNCGSTMSLVYDGKFEHLDLLKPATGFAWQVSSRGDVEVSLARNPSGNRLLLGVNGTTSQPVLTQLVVVKPGTYRIAWLSPDTPDNQARALQVALDCKVDLARAESGIADPATPFSRHVDVVVGNDCPAHKLVFWLAPKASAQLENVSLTLLGSGSN